LPAGIHAVFRGSKFFSNAGVGEINKNLNIEYSSRWRKARFVRSLFFSGASWLFAELAKTKA
jgi:hypothetical protein